MAKKTKVSVDDFAFFDEEEAQPLNLIAKSIQKSDSVHEPKLSQSEAKLKPPHEPKLSQSEAKPKPKRVLSVKLKPKVEPQPEPLHEPKLSQSEAKPEPIGTFESLVGLQRDALIFVFDSCLNSGSKISGAITISNLATSLRSTVAAVRKAIQRLEQKGYISRSQFKDGRGGWTKYEIPQGIYSDLLSVKSRAKVEPKLSQTRAKVSTQPEPQPEPSTPYSSSNNFNIYTNTIELPENLRRFGISTVNLEKLVSSGKTTQEVIERSLSALSFDVENGKTGSLANILFGVLGTGREYISQRYSESIQKELDAEITRIQLVEESAKKLEEVKLQLKFKAHLEQNPDFLDLVKKRNSIFANNSSVIEKVALEEFKMLELTQNELKSNI